LTTYKDLQLVTQSIDFNDCKKFVFWSNNIDGFSIIQIRKPHIHILLGQRDVYISGFMVDGVFSGECNTESGGVVSMDVYCGTLSTSYDRYGYGTYNEYDKCLTSASMSDYSGFNLCDRTSSGKLLKCNEYEGHFLNNKFHGQGVRTLPTMTLLGYFENGGFRTGSVVYPNGDIHSGEFRNNVFVGDRNVSFCNGDTYSGSVVGVSLSGVGTMNFKNGDIYVGMWASDKFHGWGTLTKRSGSRIVSLWKDGKRVNFAR
jgi:hypothetical protein